MIFPISFLSLGPRSAGCWLVITGSAVDPLAHFSCRTTCVPRVTQLPRHILPSGCRTERCTGTSCAKLGHAADYGVPLPCEVSFETCESRAARFYAGPGEAHITRSTDDLFWPRKSGSNRSSTGWNRGFQFLQNRNARSHSNAKLLSRKRNARRSSRTSRCNCYPMNNLMPDIGSIVVY